MGLTRAKPEKLDEATELALDWAIDVLGRKLPAPGEDGYDAKAWDKDHQRKAQAAALVGMLKARTDPAGLRASKSDRVAAILEAGLRKAARRKRPNGRAQSAGTSGR